MVQFQQSLDEEQKQQEKQRQLQNVDSIIATRSRRSNAGNRLQSLLNSEAPLVEEDETANDIFREMEDDEDYDETAEKAFLSASEGDGGDDDDDDDASTNKRRAASSSSPRKPKRVKSATPGQKQTSDDEIEQKDDDMFSDSADSFSEGDDEDEDEGEKELAKQQREEKRRAQKKKRDALSSMPAALAKAQQRQKQRAKVTDAEGAAEAERLKVQKRHQMKLSADNLMSENRRRSTRKAAVKNKMDVIKRLKESEARRAKQPTPVVKVVHKLTQEERLAEAIITEKKNVESLNSFYEQEEDRKKRQRAALLAKRVPMTSFIRYVSKTTLVPASIPPPFIEEITPPSSKPKREWKKRKDAKAKDETPKTDNMEPEKNADTEKKPEQPEEIKSESTPANEANNADTKAESDEPAKETAADRRSTSLEQMEADYIIFGEDGEAEHEKKADAPADAPADTAATSKVETEPAVTEPEAVTPASETTTRESEAPVNTEPSIPKDEVLAPSVDTEMTDVADPQVVTGTDISTDLPAVASPKLTLPSEHLAVDSDLKIETDGLPSVLQDEVLPDVPSETKLDGGEPLSSISDLRDAVNAELSPENTAEKKEAVATEQEPTEEVEHIDPSKLVVEGPPACRAMTTISFMEFPDDFRYTKSEIKKMLFGPQSLEIPVVPDRTAMKPYPTSAAATHAILRAKVGAPGTKGRKPKHDAAAAGGAAAAAGEGKKGAKNLSQLGGGIFGSKGGSGSSSSIVNALSGRGAGAGGAVQTPRASLALTTSQVVPATAATPTGASAAATLANAGIPKCVVTGKPCKFVDPRTGIPYSSMEAFQIIRTVTNNTVHWNRDFGVFIGGAGVRHAKGVPPGFGEPEPAVAEAPVQE